MSETHPLHATEEDTERHQVIIKEFPDAQSGLLVEVYPYDETAYTHGPLHSASCNYIECGYTKRDAAEFMENDGEDIHVRDPDHLYARVFALGDGGFGVEVGERSDRSPDIVHVYRTYSPSDLNLDELDLE